MASPVKEFAKNNPHSMGNWESSSKSHVACMKEGDFYGNEKSIFISKDNQLDIKHISLSGKESVLKKDLAVLKDELIDASVMDVLKLKSFFEEEIQDAKSKGVLFSLHMKATMMKVSDPIIFGHAVRVFYKKLFDKYSEEFQAVGVNPNNGLGDIYKKIQKLDPSKVKLIEDDFLSYEKERSQVAMVDSSKGITNFHVPSDVIIDASMPAAIRSSGKMWNNKGETQDTKFVIPDRSYGPIYQEVIDFCKSHGAFDPKTMGSVSNIGLMAKKLKSMALMIKHLKLKKMEKFKLLILKVPF